jgi:hypothetical protein
MSKIIEDFAQSGEVPADFEDIRFYEIVGAEGDDMGGGARYNPPLLAQALIRHRFIRG